MMGSDGRKRGCRTSKYGVTDTRYSLLPPPAGVKRRGGADACRKPHNVMHFSTLPVDDETPRCTYIVLL